MFESVRPPDAVERLRAAALPPLIAFIVALLYFALYPTMTRVPLALFWSMAAVVLLGTVMGVIAIARVVMKEKIRGRAIAWLVAAVVMTLMCGRLALALTLPWF